jgi:hypothetical protein
VRRKGKTLGRPAGGGGAAGEAHRGAIVLLVAHELGLVPVMQGGWHAAQGHTGEGDDARGGGGAAREQGKRGAQEAKVRTPRTVAVGHCFTSSRATGRPGARPPGGSTAQERHSNRRKGWRGCSSSKGRRKGYGEQGFVVEA